MGKGDGICPKCGTNLSKWKRTSGSGIKWFLATILIIGVLVGPLVYLVMTNKQIANEIRQMRQPKPNRFFVGIDVSATIDPETLNYFKTGIAERLRQFVGDSAVSYEITTFGNPGCGPQSVDQIVETTSPDDLTTFRYEVKESISQIRVAQIPTGADFTTPLTTPLYYLMEKALTENVGGRVIIFSDLMNDDSDCSRQYLFPESAVETFGGDNQGQIIFLYPTPHFTNSAEQNARKIARQKEFINRINKYGEAGSLRAFFYHIPDEAERRAAFIESQLTKSIPTTTFEVIYERVSKIISTIVSAVRG